MCILADETASSYNTHMRLLFFFGLVFLGFSSCIEEVELDLGDSVRERLIVLSNFNTTGAIEVVVSSSRGVISNPDDAFIYHEDADVRLYNAADELLETLCLAAMIGRGEVPFYTTKNFDPQPGELYTVRVTVPGFAEMVEATGSIPEAVRIDEIEFDNTYNVEDPRRTMIDFNVTVTFTDPAVVQNFYHLTFFQELLPTTASDSAQVGEVEVVSLPVIGAIDNPPLLPYVDNRGALFTDASFDGETVIYRFSGKLVFNSQRYTPRNFVTELRTVSQSYYNYHASITRQKNNSSPLGSGVDLDGNSNGGVGVFAGYNSSTGSNSINN